MKEPRNKNLVDGKSKKSFGTSMLGVDGKTKIFAIQNQGTGPLVDMEFSIIGANPADFILTKPFDARLPAGKRTTFKVTFKPTAKGTRKAAIQIKSNDPDESLFDITITGLGLER